MSSKAGDAIVWKHIGLHGHSVGTFSCTDDRLVWKSAISGRDNDVSHTTTRSVPKDIIAGAQWTIFGRSGHLRVQTKQQQQDKKNQQIPHELRFDGFPANDFDALKEALYEKYGITVQIHSMSAAGTQYGLPVVKGKSLVFKHCVLDEMNEEGQEFEPRAEDEMMSVNLADVSQCVLPGNNRNEIEVQFPESDAVEAGTDQLGEFVGCCFLFIYSLIPQSSFLLTLIVSTSITTRSLDSLLYSSRPRSRPCRQRSCHGGRTLTNQDYGHRQCPQDDRRRHCQL
jgi:hypothetical protein